MIKYLFINSFILAWLLSAAELPTNLAGWPQSMLKGLSIIQNSPDKTIQLAASGKLEKHLPPHVMTVNVTGLDTLWLSTGGGGDGTGGDHTCWLNPVFTTADGKTVDGTSLPILMHCTGWSTLQTYTPQNGKKLSSAKKQYNSAWWIHPDSHMCLKLDKKFVSFTVGAAVSDSAHYSKYVDFSIEKQLAQPVVINTFATSQAAAFPQIEDWLKADLNVKNSGHEALLKKHASLSDTLTSLITSQAKRIGVQGNHLLTKLAAIPKDAMEPRLALYLEARIAGTIVQDTEKAIDFAQRTLEFVEKQRPLPELSARLKALKQTFITLPSTPDGNWNTLLADIKALRRRIILSHPALDFQDLLINKQPSTTFSHQCDQYLGRHSRPGPGLVILKNWKDDAPQAVELLTGKLPTGSVSHPDLSFDGKKILFSFCDHTAKYSSRRFFIYEINADGTGLRQLTGTAEDPLHGEGNRETVLIEDFDPCYLPDGDIIFVSTRCQTFGRCHHRRYNPSYLLYKMDGNGRNIRQLSFGEANEWDPSVLNDGRVIYTRWDYINRHDTFYQSLWTIRPDGTGTAHYYGNYTINPCMTAEARAIPGSHKIVSTATAHHAYTAGSIIIVDTTKGEDGPAPLTRFTPDVRFPETEGWPSTTYQTPWPLSEDLMLAAYSDVPLAYQGNKQSPNAYCIVLIDSLGGREEIYRDTTVSCVSPIPLIPRLTPPPFCSSLPKNATPGTPGRVFISNANICRKPIKAPVRSIRLNTIIGQPTPSVPHRGAVRQEIVKHVEGTVDVAADGSAAFLMPSGVPVQLQALDENGLAVMTMRSFIYVQPGETLSCIGCHENKAQSTPPPHKQANQLAPVTPLAGQDYPGGFSFMRSVQPVFDRYCISCHGLDKTAAGLDLRGTPVKRPCDGYPGWPQDTPLAASYNNLVNRKGLFRIAQRNEETGESISCDYFAHSGKLADLLLNGHCKPLLADTVSLRLIMTWLDLNAQYHGDYSWNRPEDAAINAEGEKALREAIAERFGEALAKQPYACLVNPAAPELSRILRIALPAAAGGWQQITDRAFTSTEDPAWLRFATLVKASITPPQPAPANGTCGWKRCICGSCWVHNAEQEHKH